MSEEKPDTHAYYKNKGLKRHVFIVKPETHAKLKGLARHFGVIQGQVIDVMVEKMMAEQLEEDFAAIRVARLEERRANVTERQPTTKMEVRKQITGATQEQLAAIQAILNAGQ